LRDVPQSPDWRPGLQDRFDAAREAVLQTPLPEAG
jgi:hypothetical protein